MTSAVVWTTAAVLGILLVIGLTWAQAEQRRRARERRSDVDWAAAALLELAVVAAAVEHLLLTGVLWSGAPGTRLLQSLLPGAATAVLGFLGSIALLAVHRRRPTGRADAFAWRRIGVTAPGLIGFVALAWMSTTLLQSSRGALSATVLSALAAPALTALLGVVLGTRVLAVALVPQVEIIATTADEPGDDAADEAVTTSIAAAPERSSAGWDAYRRPPGPPA